MTSQSITRALILGAGPQMQCGVGQFTLRLAETIEKLEPGSTAALTLSQKEGSIAAIWRAVGSARNVVCNFPIVAWKRVILAPLLALLFARLRGRTSAGSARPTPPTPHARARFSSLSDGKPAHTLPD